jgi:hypothetical protein
MNLNYIERTCYSSANQVLIGIATLRVADKTINAINQLLPKALPALSSASKALQYSFLVSALLIPIHLYKISQISKSNDFLQTKALSILMEMGNIFGEAILVISWISNNVVPQLAKSIPYLIGISLIFQGMEIYKIRRDLYKLDKYTTDEKIEEIYQKIMNSDTLEPEDSKIFEEVFKVESHRVEEFCTHLKDICDEARIKNHLKGRVKRTITSQKVQLAAAVIETVASIVMLGSVLAAPPLALPLLIANASLLGSGTALRIASTVIDSRQTNNIFIQP